MSSRIALATLALGTALTVVPAIAQNYGTPDNPAPQQYKYQIGRPVNDGGMGYGAQNTQNNGQRSTANRPQAARPAQAPYRQAQTQYQGQYGEGPNGGAYYNYAGAPEPAAADQGAIAWCRVHFRSFDPATGTFMGLDGIRHNCP